ncbi:rCG38975, isoform CRA_b [Rattus norvegicus]|uniref:RCG38975, isoform CRA_b n=1 Tax=Rattus norvegicus TaxID=10116 RepID=A6KL68_RAT|nr:rCG38975, isoform CRA_b [Rattus norvegicus]
MTMRTTTIIPLIPRGQGRTRPNRILVL